MKKADLHIHSVGSDGRHSLDYLFEMYSKKGFDIVAITDHYTISDAMRNDEIIKIKEDLYGLKIIIGMETVGLINGEHVHLLCYFNSNSDISEKIKYHLSGQADFVRDLNEKVKVIMNERGVDIPDIDYSKLESTSYMPILMEVVKRTGSTIRNTRREFFTFMKDLGVPEEKKLNAEEFIEEVHKSKGLIFVAHPFEFKEETVLKAIEMGVDGIEAIYPSYSDEQRNELMELAKKHNLLYSAGSDFHCTIVDNQKHGEVGSVSLEGIALRNFMEKLTGQKKNENLIQKVTKWLSEEGVSLEKANSGEQYFATFNNKTVIVNLIDFNLNNGLFKLNSSKRQSMEILKKFGVSHVNVYDLVLDLDKSYEKALDFYYTHDKKCVIRGEKGTCGLNTFIITDISDIKIALGSILSQNIRPLISPYFNAPIEYRVYLLNGKAELVISKERCPVTGKHNLSLGSNASIVNDNKIISELEAISIDVANIFGLKFAAIDILKTEDGLKVIEFGIPNINKFSSLSEENEVLAKKLFFKAFMTKLNEANFSQN